MCVQYFGFSVLGFGVFEVEESSCSDPVISPQNGLVIGHAESLTRSTKLCADVARSASSSVLPVPMVCTIRLRLILILRP